MKAGLLRDRGVVKVAGDDARAFLNGMLTTDVTKVTPEQARFGALLTPQGKIIVDCIVAEAPAAEGGGFFLDCPKALAFDFVKKLNFYKLRAKVICEDLSEVLGVMAVWDGPTDAKGADTDYGLVYADPRLPALGQRVMLPPHLVKEAAAELGANLVDAPDYEEHRISLAVPRGGADFIYGDAFPHETDMDQLSGIDFDKGCYVGQEVVSRMEHRGTARTRAVPVRYDGAAPQAGAAITAGARPVGTLGSAANGYGVALVRLDRAAEALSHGDTLAADGVPIRLVKPEWARFAFPGESEVAPGATKAAE
jgi:tRNA-modifying protein YgfZ